MYIVDSTKAYRKAYKRFLRHEDFNRQILEGIVSALARGEKLDAKYLDHQLSGEFQDYRECHVKNDILLMYQIHEDILLLLLVKLGTHDDIFR